MGISVRRIPTMTPEDVDQTANGDGNTQIGGDGNIAGRDITTTIIQGVPPSEHARVLAQLEILKEKLAIALAADRDDPSEEEVQSAGEAMDAAEELEEMGAELDAWSYIDLGDAAELRGKMIFAVGYNREALRLFTHSGDREGEAWALGNLANISRLRGEYEEAKQFYNDALVIAREIEYPKGIAAFLRGLGNLSLIHISEPTRPY